MEPATYHRRRFRRSARNSVGTGTTSLLMIFTVLCFATLAMLSLSTAVSNRRIQERSFAGATLLAQAEGEAAAKMAQLDEALLNLDGQDADGYFDAALKTAREQGWEAGDEENNILLVLPMDAENEFVTELTLLSPGQSGRYAVVRQVTRYTGTWAPEAPGQVWQGE